MTTKRARQMLAALLAALTLLSLAACGNVTVVNEENTAGDTTVTQQTNGQKKDTTAKSDGKQTEDAKQAEENKQEEQQKPQENQTTPAQSGNTSGGSTSGGSNSGNSGNSTSGGNSGGNSGGSGNTCTISISCNTILNNMDKIDDEAVAAIVPASGVILSATTVTFTEGESVFDVLQRVCRDNGIQMDSKWTPKDNSAYVKGIANLYEFDVGSGSGWMYKVYGWFPNYGCSAYELKGGENICWVYTCNLGDDVGGGYVG